MKAVFLSLLLGMVLYANVAGAVSFNATVTADNHYAIYVGDESGVTFIGGNELGYYGSDGGFNWTDPENFSFNVDAGDYIYIAGWSDDHVAQGWIGQFVTSTYTLLSNTTDWEVYLTFQDLDDNDSPPTETQLKNDITGVSWQAVTNYIDHGSSPWGNIAGISQDADWIWGSPLLGGSNYGEYQIFRTQVVPEPTTILLSGLGLLGMGAYLRRRRNGK